MNFLKDRVPVHLDAPTTPLVMLFLKFPDGHRPATAKHGRTRGFPLSEPAPYLQYTV